MHEILMDQLKWGIKKAQKTQACLQIFQSYLQYEIPRIVSGLPTLRLHVSRSGLNPTICHLYVYILDWTIVSMSIVSMFFREKHSLYLDQKSLIPFVQMIVKSILPAHHLWGLNLLFPFVW